MTLHRNKTALWPFLVVCTYEYIYTLENLHTNNIFLVRFILQRASIYKMLVKVKRVALYNTYFSYSLLILPFIFKLFCGLIVCYRKYPYIFIT